MDAEPLHRRTALVAGYTDAEYRRRCHSPGWSRLRVGSYLPPGEMSAERRHRLLVAATLPAIAPEAVLSHQSAVVLHGLPIWNVPLDRVHVTRDRPSGGRRTRGLHVHCAPLPPDAVEGRICGAARAVADLSRTAGFEQAVVIGDAGLRAGVFDTAELLATAGYAIRRPGYRTALRAFGFLDERSESVGESRSRVMLYRLGFPAPEPQLEVRDEHGRFVGRVDFGWVAEGVLGEFDGRTKYGRSGEAVADAVFREKLREDRLRELGWSVVRWTWADLDQPEVVRERLRRAFAAPHPTRGAACLTAPRAESSSARKISRAAHDNARGGSAR